MISAINGKLEILQEKVDGTIQKIEMELRLLTNMLRDHLKIEEDEMDRRVAEARIFGVKKDK